MRTLIFIIAMLAFSTAQAWDIEFGTGTTNFKHGKNGRWFVEGYPYFDELHDVPLSVGVSHVIRGIRYRAEYLRLGEARVTFLAPGDDQYNPFRSQHGGRLYAGFGRGSVAGGLVSASKDISFMGIPLYAEAGAYFYRPKWNVGIYDADTMEYLGISEHNDQIQVGPVLGVGIRWKAIDIGIRYYNVEARGDNVPALWTNAYTGMVKVVF